LQQAEDGAGVPDVTTPERASSARGQGVENDCVQRTIKKMAGSQAQVQAEWVVSQPQAFDAKLGAIIHQDTEYGGMKVHVQMAVHMVERQAGSA
jgi:hypothetical protein